MTTQPHSPDVQNHDARTAKYLAKRRKVLPTDDFVTDYDGTDEQGHKYREHEIRGGGGTSQTIQSDLTAMYQCCPSTTGDMEILRIEAELVADGKELENPHVPANEDLFRRAKNTLEKEGLTPAWETGL